MVGRGRPVDVQSGVGFAQVQKGHLVPVRTKPVGHAIAHAIEHDTVDDWQVTVSLVNVVVGVGVSVGRVMVVSVGVTVGMLGVAVHRGVGFAHEQKGHFVPVTVIPEGHPMRQ
jgi:hypothetical protein